MNDLFQFDPLMRNFINITPSSAVHDPAIRGQFSSKWHSMDPFFWGLHLTYVLFSVELPQVNIIWQFIGRNWHDNTSRQLCFISAQAAIYNAITDQGLGLRFLYRYHTLAYGKKFPIGKPSSRTKERLILLRAQK